jgi:hypothetical protein
MQRLEDDYERRVEGERHGVFCGNDLIFSGDIDVS